MQHVEREKERERWIAYRVREQCATIEAQLPENLHETSMEQSNPATYECARPAPGAGLGFFRLELLRLYLCVCVCVFYAFVKWHETFNNLTWKFGFMLFYFFSLETQVGPVQLQRRQDVDVEMLWKTLT